MPTPLDDIQSRLRFALVVYQDTIKHVAKCGIVVLVVALILETFVFNFNHFASAGYNTVNLSDQLNLIQTSDDKYRVSSVNHTLEFSNLNREVRNVRIDFTDGQAAQTVDVTIHFTDAAHQTHFDSTEYTAGIPTTTVATNCPESEYINLNTAGMVGSLRIEIAGEDVQYPLLLDGVYVNARIPFQFNMGRFALAAAVLALVYIFRPKSSIYRSYIVDHPVKSRACIILTVAIELYLVTSFLFLGSNLVGVATSSYNAGSWDGTSIVNTFEVGGENAQQYAELAKAMAHGQLYLEEEPPQWLQDMDDPYDKGARDELQKATGEDYLFDVAYHDGHYYVYFGVVPVLVFYLPFYLLTGANFPTAIGVLVAAWAFILGCSALLDRFARYHFKRVSLGLYLLLQIPLVFCCGILYLVKHPTFYSLPIMMALAFSVWGLYFWMRGRASRRTAAGWYFAGSLCMALVVGCRPQLVVLSFVAFPLFWRRFITEGHLFTKRGALEFACLVAPYCLVAAGLFWYNKARFGSITDFGANYNLTVNDMTKRGMNVGRLAPALFAYFLQPPNVTGVFPYIQAVDFDTTYMGQTIKEVTFGGVFACLPFLWILPFAKRILALRIRQRATRTIAGVTIVLVTSGVVVGLLDAEMAGILQRYYADFSFMFLMAAVLLAFIANENIPYRSRMRDLLMSVLLALVAASVVYSALLCLVAETGWYSDIYSWAYQNILETFMFWT